MLPATPAGPDIPTNNAPLRKQYSPALRHESASPAPQTEDNRVSGIPHPGSTSLLPASQSPAPFSPPPRPPPPASRNKRVFPPPPPSPSAADENKAAWQSQSRPRPSSAQSSQ